MLVKKVMDIEDMLIMVEVVSLVVEEDMPLMSMVISIVPKK